MSTTCVLKEQINIYEQQSNLLKKNNNTCIKSLMLSDIKYTGTFVQSQN